MNEIGKEQDIIRNYIDTIILCLLEEQDRYGYELYKEVLTRTDGRYELKEPSLYSAFRRLEQTGSITAYWGDESQGGRRKYYHLTEAGNRHYERALHDWKEAQQLMALILGEKV